jgi:transcriptional regulator with XRE-family HTH domain
VNQCCLCEPARDNYRITQAWDFREQVATRMGVSVARVSQSESGDVSTQDVLNRFVTALGGTLKLIGDFGDEELKIT